MDQYHLFQLSNFNTLIHNLCNREVINMYLNNIVVTIVYETNTIPSLAASTVTNDEYIQETGLSNEQKKDHGRNIYTWKIPG